MRRVPHLPSPQRALIAPPVRRALPPANDNDPPEPPPAASSRVPYAPRLAEAIAALSPARTGAAACAAA